MAVRSLITKTCRKPCRNGARTTPASTRFSASSMTRRRRARSNTVSRDSKRSASPGLVLLFESRLTFAHFSIALLCRSTLPARTSVYFPSSIANLPVDEQILHAGRVLVRLVDRSPVSRNVFGSNTTTSAK